MADKRREIRIMTLCGLLILIAAGWLFAQEPGASEDYFLPPVGLETGWYARIETSRGRIIARLLPDQAPQSVAHFVGLAEGTLEWTDPVLGETQKGRYYDNIQVDLAKAGERFEAGGLESDPSRTPPSLYVPPTEGKGPVAFGAPGRLGMTASIGGRVSAVKFFVTAAAAPYFNKHHPCFGTVVEGWNVVQRISEVKTYSNGRPIEPVAIHKIRIFTVGDPEPLPEPEIYLPQLKEMNLKEDAKR